MNIGRSEYFIGEDGPTDIDNTFRLTNESAHIIFRYGLVTIAVIYLDCLSDNAGFGRLYWPAVID